MGSEKLLTWNEFISEIAGVVGFMARTKPCVTGRKQNHKWEIIRKEIKPTGL